MSVLFVARQRYHPEDVQPNIVVPYASIYGTASVLDTVKLSLGVQGLKPRLIKMDHDFAYDQLFRALWADGYAFVLIEHDIVAWPGAVQQIWSCDHAWCGCPYYVFGELRSYLGCTKFDPRRLGSCPVSGELKNWQLLDQIIERELITRQYQKHLHQPAVTHLNFAHVRQTSAIVEHPAFWKD